MSSMDFGRFSWRSDEVQERLGCEFFSGFGDRLFGISCGDLEFGCPCLGLQGPEVSRLLGLTGFQGGVLRLQIRPKCEA